MGSNQGWGPEASTPEPRRGVPELTQGRDDKEGQDYLSQTEGEQARRPRTGGHGQAGSKAGASWTGSAADRGGGPGSQEVLMRPHGRGSRPQRVGEWGGMAPGRASPTSAPSWAPFLPFYLIFPESLPFPLFMSLTDTHPAPSPCPVGPWLC